MEKPKNHTCDDYRPEQLNQTTRKQTLHIHHHAVASRVAAKPTPSSAIAAAIIKNEIAGRPPKLAPAPPRRSAAARQWIKSTMPAFAIAVWHF